MVWTKALRRPKAPKAPKTPTASKALTTASTTTDASSVDEGYNGILQNAALQSTPPSSPVREIEIVVEDDYQTTDDSLRTKIINVERSLLDMCNEQERLSLMTGHWTTIPSAPSLGNTSPAMGVLPIHTRHAYPCQDTHKMLPSSPSKWAQCPVMLRPSPNTNTKIRGIRYANSTEYRHFRGFCAGCILPINNGTEPDGRSLVIDFESKYFVGTLLMRIRDAPDNVDEERRELDGKDGDNKSNDYFAGKKRKFQAIVQGKFKKALPISECVTGQALDRPGGKLPAKWIVSSFIRFVSTLAPQLEVQMDGNNPRFLTPLAATAQTVLCKPNATTALDGTGVSDKSILVDTTEGNADDDEEAKDRLVNYHIYAGSRDIESSIEEPAGTDATSLFQFLPNTTTPQNEKSSVSSRQKARKKAVNSLVANKSDSDKFSLDQEYTFEFYQHLLLFDKELAVDMGRPIGKVPLAPITDGQPLKFLASHKQADGSLDHLWSFDIWHKSLYEYAKQAL